MGLFDFFQKKKYLPQEPAFVEKRMLPRWKISTPAKIKWQNAKDYLVCEARDLSMRGACLELAEKIPENDAAVELYFNEKYFFYIEISIAWHKEVDGKHIYGIRFIRVRDSDREKIYQMIRENFPHYLWRY